MADKKISALPAATTPLAGTEVLPIVQGGVTDKVSVANLTAGRAISATELTLTTGNLIIGTSGKGIDFSATPGTGTSELLADYEEGTWSGGTLVGSNCSSITLSNATYTKIGRFVCIEGKFSATLTTTLTEVDIFFTLPFSTLANTCPAVGNVSHTLSANVGTGVIADSTGGEATTAYLGIASSQVTKANGTAFTASFSFSYAVA